MNNSANIHISVLCSVFNSEDWLDSYLNAVNEQFLENFEIIFIDASSTDASLSKILNFKFRNGIKVQVLKQETRINIYEAWNIGALNACGEYVVNWNTDDILYKSALLTYQNYLLRYNNIDLFYGPCFIRNSGDISSIVGFRNWPEYSHEILSQICICGPFPLVKRSTLIQHGLFESKYKYSGDYATWLKLSKNKCEFKKIDETIGVFYDREDSASRLNINTAQQEDREIQLKYK